MRTKGKSSKEGEKKENRRRMEKRQKSALNNRDINFASVSETPACCHLTTVPVSYNTPTASSTLYIHPHTDEQIFEGDTVHWLWQMYSISSTCLWTVVIFSVLLVSCTLDYPCIMRWAIAFAACEIASVLTTVTVSALVYQADTHSATVVSSSGA